MIPGVVAGYAFGAAPALFSFVSAQVGSTDATNPLTISKPAGVVDGDFLLAYVFNSNQTHTVTPPSGWTLEFSDVSTANGIRIYSKTASSEPSTYSWTWSSNARSAVSLIAYRGVTAVDVIGALTRVASGSSAAADSITATADGVLVAAFANEYTGGAPAVTSDPNGMTLRGSHLATFAAIRTYDLLPAASGATGVKTITWDNPSNSSGILVQLK